MYYDDIDVFEALVKEGSTSVEDLELFRVEMNKNPYLLDWHGMELGQEFLSQKDAFCIAIKVGNMPYTQWLKKRELFWTIKNAGCANCT